MNGDTEQKKAQLVERRKEQILAAAKVVFAQNGFRRTKVEQIAANLGVGKGTLYRYFVDKKSLFLAVFAQGIIRLREIIRTDVESVANPRRRIAAAVRTYFAFFENDRELIEILMQVRSEFKDDYQRIFLALYKDYIVKIRENLRSGIKAGVFRKLDVEKTAEAISAALQGVLQDFYVRSFGVKTAASDTGEKAPADSEAPAEAGLGHSGKERLTDRTEAVTKLLLEGLLARDSNQSA